LCLTRFNAMSFDVFLQSFQADDAATIDARDVLDALARFSIEPVTADSWWIRTTDGRAQVFGLDDAGSGFMVNHASGRVIWDALVHVADVTGLTILPIGCPACVTRPELLEHLPDELRPDARIVTSGEQLIAAFNS
jgi:hypothetical protein